jgi:hypothetical protein
MKVFQISIFGFFFASVLSWSEDEVELGCGYDSCPKEVPGRSESSKGQSFKVQFLATYTFES